MTENSTPKPNSTLKPRAPIDLDEFERQLREMQTQPKHNMSDPLAELARIVGHDDPLVFSRDEKKQPEQKSGQDISRTASSQSHASSIFDELSNLRQQTSRGSLDQRTADQGTFELEGSQFASVVHMDESTLHEQPFAGEPPEFLTGERADYNNDYDAPQPSRAGMKIFGAMVALGTLAVAGVWGFSGLNTGNTKIAENTPVITAKTGPVKEKPANPGGAEVPNLNADILQKNKDASKDQPKLVPREEQPVDLSQAVKKDIRRVDLGQIGENGAAPVVLVPIPNAQTNGNSQPNVVAPPVVPQPPKPPVAINPLPMIPAPVNTASSGANGTGAIAPSIPIISTPVLSSVAPVLPPFEASNVSNGGPKKVKSVRITTGEPSVQVPSKTDNPVPKPPQKAAAPKPAKTTPAQPKTTPDVALRSDVPETASEAPLQLTPPAGVSRKGQKIAANTTPTAVTPAAKAPKPVKAPVEEVETAAETLTETAPPKTSGGGKFSVQFGAPGSTAEAQSLISRLKSKYPSVMGSVDARVVKAQVNGRDVYRVRSGSVGKDQANTLCADMKAAGGSCFISGG